MKDICFVNLPTLQDGRMHEAVALVLPPLGLAYLAAELLRQGREVEIIDAFAEGLGFAEVYGRLENNYRVVGFYCHTQIVSSVEKMARALKASRCPPTIVVGGSHPAALPEETMRGCEAFDFILVGEAEETMRELALCGFSPAPAAGVDGLVLRDGDKILRTRPRAFIDDLDTIAMPAWHLLPLGRYRSLFEAGGKRVMTVMTSRGCFARCKFCPSPAMWGGRVRSHSVGRVIEEVDILRSRFGVEFFEFYDDNFTCDRARLKTLCAAFRERRLNWCCSSRIDLLGEANIGSLLHGRVSHVFVGVESMNDRLLKVLGKECDSERIRRTIDLCARRGLELFSMFIFGIPTETDAEIAETLNYVNRSPLNMVSFSHLTIFPGTLFWEEFSQSSCLSRDFSTYCWCSSKSFIATGKSPEEQSRLVARAYLRFYLRPRRAAFLVLRAFRNGASLAMFRVFLSVMFGFVRALFSGVRGKRRDKRR